MCRDFQQAFHLVILCCHYHLFFIYLRGFLQGFKKAAGANCLAQALLDNDQAE